VPVVAVLATGTAHADDEPRVARPWAVRGDAFLLGGTRLGSDQIGAAAATMQRVLWRRFAWEETIGWDPGERGRGGNWTFAGTARAAAWMSEDRTHALTGALGAALVRGDQTLHFLFAEAGYEYRGPRGLSLLVVVGPNLLLSHPPADMCRDDTGFCRGQPAYLGHARVGAGWAF
jgi:hypothetical protein